MAAATTEGVDLAEGAEAGVAEATRETAPALAVAATRGATPPKVVVAALSQGAALTHSQAAGTRAGTSTPGTRGAVEGIREGAEAARCTRCAHYSGAPSHGPLVVDWRCASSPSVCFHGMAGSAQSPSASAQALSCLGA